MTRITRLALAFMLGLSTPALATWSIVVSDAATGEVGVGSATCLVNFDLERGASVVVVGKGAAQAQASVDQTGVNRMTIFSALQSGLTAPEVLDALRASDSALQTHQYGIVDLLGNAATFTGTSTSQHTSGRTGQIGSIAYSIQGNVLTGRCVLDAAEQALRDATGDLSQRLMASMQAARAAGGDGRCSCSRNFPTSCGCPPATFTRSAYVGYMVIARIGDVDGTCNSATGCASGSYWMNLNVSASTSADPVGRLQALYDQFRASKAGHPDAVLSQATLSARRLRADGASHVMLRIALRDIDGMPVAAFETTTITVTHDTTSAGASTIGSATNNGDGTISVPIDATLASGLDVFRIVVDDGSGPVTLHPFPTLDVVAPLRASATSISSGVGDSVRLDLFGGDDLVGRRYVVLGTASGTTPGFDFRGRHVPLNLDPFTFIAFESLGSPSFPGGRGAFNRHARSAALFDPGPGRLADFVGRDLTFVWVAISPLGEISPPVAITVDP